MSFEIHSQLASDTHHMIKLRYSHVLLHKNALLPWFILVPKTKETDLLDLPDSERISILKECSEVSTFIKREWDLEKINFGAIGNVVPQMHLHIVGRSPNDPCWPAPVWGNLKETKDYSREEINQYQLKLSKALSDFLA